jgi:segregation and condensation protein B
MARVEAALLVASGSMSPRKLVQAATLADSRDLTAIIDRLNAAYDARGTAFRIERVAGGYRLLTRPNLADWLGKIFHRLQEAKLSPPALETLSIVAYRQPVTRADVEVIRGVSCAEMLKYLMERGLVRIAGEDNSLGRPFIYETTRAFLEKFGLGSLDDLPNAQQLRRKVQAAPTADSEEDTTDQAAA